MPVREGRLRFSLGCFVVRIYYVKMSKKRVGAVGLWESDELSEVRDP